MGRKIMTSLYGGPIEIVDICGVHVAGTLLCVWSGIVVDSYVIRRADNGQVETHGVFAGEQD